MAQSDQAACDTDLSNILRFVSDVCLRLDAWAEKPTTVPFVTFAQAFVKKMVIRTRALEQEINDEYHLPGRGAGELQGDRYWPASILETVNRVHDSIELAGGILDFCDHFDFDGEEGALIILFLALGGRTSNPYDISKREHLAREVISVLNPVLGPNAAARYHTLGRDLPQPFNPADWADFIESMRYCLDKVGKAFSPRYVHTYATRSDVPYVVDTSTNPCAGSVGVVRKVQQKATLEAFAEKTFCEVYSGKERKPVLNELGVLEICVHPNIVTLVEAYEVADEPDTINLVMSPWAPVTLHKFLHAPSSRKEHFPWFEPNNSSSDKRIYEIMLGLTKAVHYLHELSIKHKDIKPANILLHTVENQVTPYLTDVGVSKVYWQGAKTNYDQSTYPFLAPEQLAHQESSLKADIWQLGCCFAMLLTLIRGGQDGVLKLDVSFQKTDENRSCNIANELDWFMGTLNELCASGTTEQQHIHWMIRCMLDLHPLSRFDIERVRRELVKVLEM